jgi:phosphoribosylformimino-5-aminoimidazole carboxamide ribotide isomerase
MADIERLLEPDCAGLAGAITGRALYDGRIDPREALALIRRANTAQPPGAAQPQAT